MRGRKPKPNGLRLIQGNPGKRPINKHEPKFMKGAPHCPDYLDACAKEKWKAVVSELAPQGILTKVDGDILAGYCQQYSIHVTASEFVASLDGKLTIVNAGRVQLNPMIKAARDALLVMNRLGVEYGITPSSRSRIHATPTNPDEDKDKGFFG